MNEYLILPGCDDTNCGDQALIWETVDVARAAGFVGHYSMIAEKECGLHSKRIGIDSLAHLLPHPASHTSNASDNRKYGIRLKLKWLLWTLVDLLIAIPLSNGITRLLVTRFLSREQKKTIDMYKKAKAAFVKGGGFLHAYAGIIDAYKIYYFLYHINLAHSFGIPVYILPNSYGPFSTSISKRLVKICLGKCRIIYSRESISQRILKDDCCINSYLGFDLAMYLNKDFTFNVQSYLNDQKVHRQPGKTVGITVRPYRFPGRHDATNLYQKYKQSVCNFIKWLNKNSFNPVLIEHVSSKNLHESDIVCINEILDSLNGECKISVVRKNNLNCKQMKSIYAEMDFLVGTRFHSVIFSLTEMVPSIAITYGGNKGDGIMKDLGLSDYAIPIDSIEDAIIIEKFKKLIEKQDVVKNKLDMIKKSTEESFNRIVSVIGECAK